MSTDSLPLTTDNRPLTDRLLYQGMRINIIAGSLGMMWFAVIQGMPLQMLLEALGASGVMIGLATTVAQFSLAMQIPGAFLAGRLAAPKPLWAVLTLISRGVWIVPPLLMMSIPDRPFALAATIIWVQAISGILNQSVSSVWFRWMADLIPDRMRGRFWGVRQSFLWTAFVIATAAAGWFLDVFPSPHQGAHGSWFGFIIVMSAGAALGCMDIIIHLWVPEPKPVLGKETNWLARIREPLRNADFRRLTFAMGMYTFSMGLTSLGIIYLKKDFAVSYSNLAAITIASSLGAVALGVAWGYAMDRMGGRAFGAAMLVVAPLFGLAWFFIKDYQTNFVGLFDGIRWLGPAVAGLVNMLPASLSEWIRAQTLPQPIWILLFTNFFAGALFSGISLCQISFSGTLAPKTDRTIAMAVHWAIVGGIGAFGAVIAGKVMDYFTEHPLNYILPTGTKLSFQHILIPIHMMIVWFVTLPILLRIRRREGEPQFTMAVSQLFLTNPFRSFTNIYGMAAAVTSRQKARAVRNLGRRRTVLAVKDLIDRIDDPSCEVREEAVLALGNIGSPEAVAALIRKLEDPGSESALHVVRALRIAKDRMSVDILIRRLGDSDREVKSECARALGEIGDPRAIRPLLDLLTRSTDVKILGSTAEALAHLREVSAVYRIVPLMKQTSKPLLRKILEISIGEVIGEPDEFYVIMNKEQRQPGSRVSSLLRRLRREVRRAAGSNKAETKALTGKIKRLRALFEGQDYPLCADILFEVGTELAKMRFQIEPSANIDAFVSEVFTEDPAFGAGLWYLHNLRQAWLVDGADSRSYFDVLLGIYFVASRRLKE